MRRGHPAAGLTGAAVLALAACAGGGRGSPPTTRVALADWGLSDPAVVRFGQVALIHEPGGPRLEVYVLSGSPPPPDAPDGPRARTPGLERETSLVSDFRTATWVWNTDDLLVSPPLRRRLHAFLAGAATDVVFLQVPSPGPPEPLAELVSALAEGGIRVYALDGFAGYALPGYREEALAVVDRVVAYNGSVPAGARFYGLRHDIEPYLLPGFHGPRREALLRGYLDVAAESARRARAAGMVYGLDIPFWYDAPGPVTLEPVTVTWGGSRKPVSEHAMDVADDVAVMAYRTTAWGADGTLAHVEGELTYGARVGTPVYVGLETAPLPDETLVELRGEPREGTRGERGDEPRVLIRQRGDSADVAYLAPGTPVALPAPGDATRVLVWPVASRVRVPASRLTFAEEGGAALARVMRETARALSDHDAFAGVAVHHWESHRALLEGEERGGSEKPGSNGTVGAADRACVPPGPTRR